MNFSAMPWHAKSSRIGYYSKNLTFLRRTRRTLSIFHRNALKWATENICRFSNCKQKKLVHILFQTSFSKWTRDGDAVEPQLIRRVFKLSMHRICNLCYEINKLQPHSIWLRASRGKQQRKKHKLKLPAKSDTSTISSIESFDIQINGQYISFSIMFVKRALDVLWVLLEHRKYNPINIKPNCATIQNGSAPAWIRLGSTG